VTAAQLLATAAFREGKYAQAFPSFGAERRGAPVTAYARIDERRIVDRSPIVQADYVIVLDPNVFKMSNPLSGLKENGFAILNLERSTNDILEGTAKAGIRLSCIDASLISEQVYGKKSIPITNIAMLGAFASISGVVALDTVLETIEAFFSGEEAEKAKKTAQIAHQTLKGASAL
jgi:2-oxoacid:acceptor oxidoreductase gamma subunit (pyruvate/2-ketoisovalerate family)